MKRIVKLTESDLTRIVKRVISENIEDNDLYGGINKMLFNSNASNEEQIQVLKYILKQKEGDGLFTKEKMNPDLSGLEALVQRVIKQRMDEDDLPNIVKRVIRESNEDLYNMSIKRIGKNPSGSMKGIQSYTPKTKEEINDKNFYITFIKSVIDKSPMTPKDYIGKRLSYNMRLFNLIPL